MVARAAAVRSAKQVDACSSIRPKKIACDLPGGDRVHLRSQNLHPRSRLYTYDRADDRKVPSGRKVSSIGQPPRVEMSVPGATWCAYAFGVTAYPSEFSTE